MKKSGSKVNQAWVAALARVELYKQKIEALHFAVSDLRSDSASEAHQDFAALHAWLYKKLNQAYQDLFMFGLFNEATTKEARRVAYDHFLAERKSIMQFLETSGKYPGRWTAREEIEFRQEAKRLANGRK